VNERAEFSFENIFISLDSERARRAVGALVPLNDKVDDCADKRESKDQEDASHKRRGVKSTLLHGAAKLVRLAHHASVARSAVPATVDHFQAAFAREGLSAFLATSGCLFGANTARLDARVAGETKVAVGLSLAVLARTAVH
jgi:hypothetical protein